MYAIRSYYERAYRMLFQQALRRESSAGIPDPGSFLVRINAGIDRSTGGFTAIRRRVLRPGVLAPVLSAAVILVIAGVFFFHPAADQGAGDSLFSGLINESDLTELTEISPSSAVLDDVTISDLSLDREYLAEDGPAMRDPASLSAEIDLTLLEDVPYSAVVSASLEYISPDDVLENLSDTEADRIVTTSYNFV